MIYLDRGNYNKKCGVYAICDRSRNLAYIGSTNNLYSRINSHKNALSNGEHCNPRMQYHYNKYGESAFEVIVTKLMPLSSTHSDLLKEEQLEYDRTRSRMDCFNSHHDVTFFKNNKKLNKERSSRMKLSWSENREKLLDIVSKNLEKAKIEFRRKIDSGELIMKSPRKGVAVSKETREKQSISAKMARKIKCNSVTIPVIMVNSDGEETKYESARDALRSIGISNHKLASNITACCNGRRKFAFKFKWRYE